LIPSALGKRKARSTQFWKNKKEGKGKHTQEGILREEKSAYKIKKTKKKTDKK